MTLEEIEASLQKHLAYLQKRHDENFERPSWDAWLDCYTALIACKQTQHLEFIAARLDSIQSYLGAMAPK